MGRLSEWERRERRNRRLAAFGAWAVLFLAGVGLLVILWAFVVVFSAALA